VQRNLSQCPFTHRNHIRTHARAHTHTHTHTHTHRLRIKTWLPTWKAPTNCTGHGSALRSTKKMYKQFSNASRFPKKHCFMQDWKQAGNCTIKGFIICTSHFPTACSPNALQPTRWLPHARWSGKWRKNVVQIMSLYY
jgi:hypothetical protein